MQTFACYGQWTQPLRLDMEDENPRPAENIGNVSLSIHIVTGENS